MRRTTTIGLMSILLAACSHGGAAVDSAPPARSSAACASGRLQVKLRDDSGVRLREGRLVVVPELVHAAAAPPDAALALLNGPRVLTRARLHADEPEERLDAQRAQNQANVSEHLPDLNAWFVVTLAAPEDGGALLAELTPLAAIESAACEPLPAALPAPLP